MEFKVVQVIGAKDIPPVLVVLPGTLPEERLTPAMSRRAARIAVGFWRPVTVKDEERKEGYRVYANSARFLRF